MLRNKILMVGPLPPTVGGITTCMLNILTSDLNKKYEFIPFTTSRPTERLVKDFYDYTLIFHMGLKCLIRAALTTLHHIIVFPISLAKRNPKIVHIHTTDYWPFWESSIYIFLSKMFHKKTVLHIHATSFDKFYKNGNSLLKYLTRKTLNIADKIIVLSSRSKSFFAKLVPEYKLAVIPNAVKGAIFDNELKSHIKSNVVKVLFIGGTEAKRKGVYDVLKAIPVVAEKYGPNILFAFVGECDVEKLRTICKEKNVSNYVEILGYLETEEKRKVISLSDIYILPSYSEGLPIAMLEAMAAGLPIISTPVGSIPEVIEEGVNGYLIKPGDYYGLAEKISVLAKDRQLRQIMGKNNAEKIRREYDDKIVMQKLTKVYNVFLHQ
jgi:glycosyltransferase involved in cell wall biosynthesis